jgi:LPXTG-motif cell wall-anchored protein
MSKRVDMQKLAERLSEDTDRILAGEAPGESCLTGMEEREGELRTTIERLARVIPARQPGADMRNRIRARLTVEWDATGPGSRQTTNGWRSPLTKKWTTLAWGAIGVVLLVLAGLLVTPEVLPAQTGAAQLQAGGLVIGIVLLGIIALIIWRWKHK